MSSVQLQYSTQSGEVLPDYIRAMNTRLMRQYGRSPQGKPWYRLAWSSAQFEKRFAKRNVYLEGTDIFLRQETGLLECPKYPWCADRWIIEKWMTFPPSIDGMERHRYECFWIFQDWNDPNLKALIPIWKVVEHIVYIAQTGRSRVPSSEKSVDSAIEDQIAKETKENKKEFEDKKPSLIETKLGVQADGGKREGVSLYSPSGNKIEKGNLNG